MALRSHYRARDGVILCTLSGYGHDTEFATELDITSWIDLGDGYARDATVVVAHGEPIEGADAASFVRLPGGWAKDARVVYHGGAVAEAPDDGPWHAPSFRAFGARYVADRRGVFCRRYGYDCYETAPVDDVDPAHFEEIGLTFGRDGARGALLNNGRHDPTLDAGTFTLRSHCFATDKNSVYYLCYGGKHSDELTLRRFAADPASFVVLGAHYAADDDSVFYYLHDDGDANLAELRKLHDVAPATFELLTSVDPGYARADALVFNHGQIEHTIVDPSSFAADAPGYCRDSVHLYRMVPALREVDGAQRYSIEVLVPEIV